MSRVVVVRATDTEPRSGLSVERYRRMLETGLTALTGDGEAREAVSRLTPRGVVGLKTNCLVRKINSTPVALADAVTEILVDGGIERSNVVVWERSNRELQGAGYELNVSLNARRCLGTDSNGLGYSDDFYTSGEVNSLVTRILTDVVDHSINLPVLKDHSLAGMSAGMKNMYGAIHNPNKYHDNNCSPYCAHVNNLAPIRDKHRLTVIDAVQVQYNGGPGFLGNYVDHYGGVILSTDPVACDRVALEILENLRSRHGLPPLAEVSRPVKYLSAAKQIGLGEADMDRISLEVLSVSASGNVSKGALVG